MSEKLYPHLLEIDETAQSRLEQLMPQLAKDAGATEQLKASDPMRWVYIGIIIYQVIMATEKIQIQALRSYIGV